MSAPPTLLDLTVKVEALARSGRYTHTEARAAVATRLLAEAFGWPMAVQGLTPPEWGRLWHLLEDAGLPAPLDRPQDEWSTADPGDYLGEYAYLGYARHVGDLPGLRFEVRQQITPRLRPGVTGTVDSVQFVGDRWRVALAIDRQPRPLEYVPLGMFTDWTAPLLPSPTAPDSPEASAGNKSPPPDRLSPKSTARSPARGAPRRPQSAGAVGGCGPSGASAGEAPVRSQTARQRAALRWLAPAP